jgi:hypothetical protein
MNHTKQPGPSAVRRNNAANVALAVALFCLLHPVAILIYNILCTAPWGPGPVHNTNPDHALAGIFNVLEISTVFCVLPDICLGLLPIIFGAVALRVAHRLPGRVGRGKAVTAIVLGLTVSLLSVVNAVFLGLNWRQ